MSGIDICATVFITEEILLAAVVVLLGAPIIGALSAGLLHTRLQIKRRYLTKRQIAVTFLLGLVGGRRVQAR